MPTPDAKHPDYASYIPVWNKCRAAVKGQRAIKDGGELYLKALSEQTTTEYASYQDRANYFNATGRTVDAMAGLVFQKPITAEAPAAVLEWFDDITLSEETLLDFANNAIIENITVGRGGILVEQPKAPERELSLAEKQLIGARPYFVFYTTESVINWEYKRIENVYRLCNVWLAETYKDDQGEQKPQIRQLTIDLGTYQQLVWREGGGADWSVFETINPVKNGAGLLEIPFFPIAPRKAKLDIVEPPIESLADVNIAHYKNSADLENGAHIAGLPTPYVTGVDAKNDDGTDAKIYIGSSTILLLPENATAGFLQCGSEGFATIENLMTRKEQQMAALGARMLSPEKKQAEASETHEIKRGGENSVLATIAGVVERQITRALQFAADWEGITGEIFIELNKDYIPVQFTGTDLTAWVAARQAGEISKETLFNVLKWAGWHSDETTFEEEQARIEEDGPPLGSLTEPSNGSE